MAISKILSNSEKTLNAPTLRYPLGNCDGTLTSSSYPNVELRRSGSTGNYVLSLVHNTDENSRKFYTLVDKNGNVGVGSLTTSSKIVTMSSGSSSVALSAPSVSGYTFLCWLGVASSGAVKMSYIADMLSSSTTIWIEGTASNNITFNAFALYKYGLQAN